MKIPFLTYGCAESLKRLDDYLDRELSEQEMKRVTRHLRLCRECARKFAFEADTLQAMRDKMSRLQAPPDLLAKIAETIECAEKQDENA